MKNQHLIVSVMDNLQYLHRFRRPGIVLICVRKVRVFFDNCSSESFIHPRWVDSMRVKVQPSSKCLTQWPLLHFRLKLMATRV